MSIYNADDGGVSNDDLDANRNAEAFAELSLYLNDKSLTLIFRDGKDEGKKALNILRKHYLSSSEILVIHYKLTMKILQIICYVQKQLHPC